MKTTALALLALALVAAPSGVVVHEASAIECIVNCYVCVTNNPPCGVGDPEDRLQDIIDALPLP